MRFATERSQRHTVAAKGRTYAYTYRVASWSMHSHGRLAYRPERWALVARSGNRTLLYLVPEHAVSNRKTVGVLGTRLRAGKLAQYLVDPTVKQVAA